MTETRKQLIELLEPFMDMVLSEGCLVKVLIDYEYAPGKKVKYKKPIYDKIITYEKDGYWKNKWNLRLKDYKNNGSSYITCINLDGGYSLYKTYNAKKDVEVFDKFIPIGHYDLSAVFKYVEASCYYSLFQMMIINENILFGEGDENHSEPFFETKEFEIPNKPLHLYTEQEEKDLLKLLKEIGEIKN